MLACPAQAQTDPCPPGAENSETPCVQVETERKAAPVPHQYQSGDLFVDSDRFIQISNYDRYDLPSPRVGQRYYLDGGVVYLISEAAQRVIEVIVLPESASSN